MLDPIQLKAVQQRIGITPQAPNQDRAAELMSAWTPKDPFYVEPTFKASETGNISDVAINSAKTIGNIPSSIASASRQYLSKPVENIKESMGVTSDIYKDRGFVQGSQDISEGLFDTYKKTGESIVNFLDKGSTGLSMSQTQSQALKARDELTNRLAQANKEKKDTTHLKKGLQLAIDTLADIDSEIKTKEERDIANIDTYRDLAKIPIERPIEVPLTLYGGEGITGKNIISTIAKPITRGVDTSFARLSPYVSDAVRSGFNRTKAAITPSAESTLSSIAKDWTQPTKDPKAAFNKARSVLEKTPDTPKFLAEQKLSPNSMIEDGKYMTSDAADNLRQSAGELSRDTLRPSLQAADTYIPKTSTNEISKNANNYAKSSYGVTTDNVEKIQVKIQEKLDALNRKYPDGMGLTEMHDEKIIYAENGRFSPVGDNSVTNEAIANRAISSSLGDMVKVKAPKDLPVGDFDAYLSKYYKAADYLESLHTKLAPVTTKQWLIRQGVKVGGAGLGSLLPGSGLITEFAGYQLGKAVVHALENIPNPIREMFLRNLQTSNPAAFNKVAEYMSQIEKDVASRKLLKAGETKNPIVLPQAEPILEAPYAKKMLPVQDPETGRLKKVYSSDPNYQKEVSPLDRNQPQANPPAKINKNANINETIPKKEEKVKSVMDTFLPKWIVRDIGEKSPKLNPKELAQLIEEGVAYKPKKPVTLYRGTTKGESGEGITSWTYNKEVAEMHAEVKGGKVVSKKIKPEEILIDTTELPPKLQQKYGVVDEEMEVLVKPKNTKDIKGSIKIETLVTTAGATAVGMAIYANADKIKEKVKKLFSKEFYYTKTSLEDEGRDAINRGESLKTEVSAYSPTKDQTDDRPREMASGKEIYEGALASGNRSIPFGTKVYFPAFDKVFTVEDRMNERYTPLNSGKQLFDILIPESGEKGRKKAKVFGKQKLDYVILK